MNILLFSQRFWPENFRINDIAEKLSNKNKVFVVTEKPNYSIGKIPTRYTKSTFYYEKWKNIEIYRSPTIERGKDSKFKLLLNYLNFILTSPIVLLKSFKKKKIDIIFIYATSPIFQALPVIIFAKFYKIPVVLWVQDIWPDVLKDLNIIKRKLILNFIGFLVNKIYTNSDYIFTQSESFKKKISKKIKNKIEVLFNPESKIKKQQQFKIKRIKKDFIITYAGNIGKAQSFETLVKAVKKIKNSKIKIHIYGDGSEKNKLKKIITKFNLMENIKLFDPVSKKKINIILSKSDAFLLILAKGGGLSSTLPAKIQTYVSHFKPIIVSADGESYNFVKKNKLGFVSKAESSVSLHKSIIKTQLLKKNDLKLIRNRSKAVFERDFEIDKWITMLELKLEKCAEDYKKNLNIY